MIECGGDRLGRGALDLRHHAAALPARAGQGVRHVPDGHLTHDGGREPDLDDVVGGGGRPLADDRDPAAGPQVVGERLAGGERAAADPDVTP
jgi:hypothetical protein